jgi:hypothetical protein
MPKKEPALKGTPPAPPPLNVGSLGMAGPLLGAVVQQMQQQLQVLQERLAGLVQQQPPPPPPPPGPQQGRRWGASSKAPAKQSPQPTTNQQQQHQQQASPPQQQQQRQTKEPQTGGWRQVSQSAWNRRQAQRAAVEAALAAVSEEEDGDQDMDGGMASPPAPHTAEEQNGLHPEGWSGAVYAMDEMRLGIPGVCMAQGDKTTSAVQKAQTFLSDYAESDAPAAVVTTQPVPKLRKEDRWVSVPKQLLVWRKGSLRSENLWVTQARPEDPLGYSAPGVSVSAKEDTSEVLHLEMAQDLAAAT